MDHYTLEFMVNDHQQTRLEQAAQARFYRVHLSRQKTRTFRRWRIEKPLVQVDLPWLRLEIGRRKPTLIADHA